MEGKKKGRWESKRRPEDQCQSVNVIKCYCKGFKGSRGRGVKRARDKKVRVEEGESVEVGK